MTKVGIIDYRAGNIRSIMNAFDHVGVDAQLVTSEEDLLDKTHVVLPGVGAYGFCKERLAESGLLPALEDWALHQKRPLLGICVGMQLMSAIGFEMEQNMGLDWLGGEVRPLAGQAVRVPHVGWNNVLFEKDFGVYAKGDEADFYFDHSFAFFKPSKGEILGTCEHGVVFCAIIRRENIVAAQFHPEKSQDAGLKFLQSFLEMGPQC